MTTCELCGERVPAAEILDHLRLFHPAEYDDDIAEAIDATSSADDQEGLEVARIVITRTLTDDDTLDWIEAVDSSGDDLPLTEALGMLRLAEDTLIRDRMGADE